MHVERFMFCGGILRRLLHAYSSLIWQTSRVPCSIPDSVNCAPTNVQSRFIDRKQTNLCSILMMNAVWCHSIQMLRIIASNGLNGEFFDAYE